MFKIYWDEATEQLMYTEVSEEEYEKRYENRTDKPIFWLKRNFNVDARIDQIKYDIYSGNIEIIRCKDCGHDFLLTKKNIEWYDENGFDHPKRCMACRKKRKDAKEKAAKKETMRSKILKDKKEDK